jgi:hypothetical protein
MIPFRPAEEEDDEPAGADLCGIRLVKVWSKAGHPLLRSLY